MRRLTEAQYRNAIADIFGPHIRISGRFEPISRPEQGLFAIGASDSSVSPAGFEQYDTIARTISSQVLEEANRPTFVPCTPKYAGQADPDCARAFYGAVGRYIFRRPLSPAELEMYVGLAGRGTDPSRDFYTGLGLGLATMLVSPEFLYLIETTANGRELDAYSKASRLSFLFWNTIPDRALLAAAERGDLDTPAGMEAQVDRLLSSPKLEHGVRAFFADFLSLERVPDVAKDPVVYERFNRQVAQDIPEQLLRTVVDHLIISDRPYTELFTTRKTFVTRRLGALYSAPVPYSNGWQAYEFPQEDRRAGLLGHAAFLALFAHEGRSSPTLRGKAIREVLMCQPVPIPPPNVDFSGFNDTSNVVLKTARQRLDSHNTDPVCASCHKITDPLGLPLEQFDGIGAFRASENGAPIDTSGEFEGQAFEGVVGLGTLLAKSPTPSACFVRRVVEYATGLDEDATPPGWTEAMSESFANDGFRIRPLLRRIALSPEFYALPANSPKVQTPKRLASYASAQKENH